MMDRKLIQQGDVLFFLQDAEPQGLKVKQAGGKIVVREGEATGHAHATEAPGVTLYEDKHGTLWLRVEDAPADVTHQEHATVTLDPGFYRVGAVREVDPFADEVRYVAD